MVYGSVLFLAWIIQNLKCDVKIIEFFVVMSVLWRKGANCFAPVAHSVCQSVCRPSDVRSIFLDPLLESGQTWYGGGCLLRVDDHSYFVATWSKVKVLWPVFKKMLSAQCLLTPLIENRQTRYSGCPLRVFPTDIQITWPNVKVKLLSSAYLKSYDSSCESRANYQLLTIEMPLKISLFILPSN